MEDLEGVYRAIPSATNEPFQAPLKDVRISWSEAFVVMGDPKGTAKLEAPAANALMEKASILEKVGPADQAVEAAVDDMVTVSVTESGSKRSGTTSAAVGIGRGGGNRRWSVRHCMPGPKMPVRRDRRRESGLGQGAQPRQCRKWGEIERRPRACAVDEGIAL